LKAGRDEFDAGEARNCSFNSEGKDDDVSTALLQKKRADLSEPATDEEREALLNWLDDGEVHPAVGVLLRMESSTRRSLDALPEGDTRIPEVVARGCSRSLEAVRATWSELVRAESHWSAIRCYRSLGMCTLCGPSEQLRRFLEMSSIGASGSAVSGYIYGGFLSTPESAPVVSAPPVADADVRCVLESFGRECFEMGRAGADSGRVGQIARSDSLLAAVFGGREWRKWLRRPAPETDVLDALCDCKSEFDYLNQLQIGNAESWGSDAGRGKVVCVIDSGADESHPALQTQVCHYLRFDVYGHDKEAYACMDNACHGTKVAAAICGKPVDLSVVDRDGTLRLGIAPGAKLFVISALNGDCTNECGTWDQLLSGLQHAVSRKARLGHDIINISMEPNSLPNPKVAERIDWLLELLQRNGIVPVLAAGNRGANSCPLGRSGYYIGAIDGHGNPNPQNGPRVDLLAPGDLICAQPISPRLNKLYFGKYSGSSLAAATAAGAVALVASAKNIPSSQAMKILIESAVDRRLSIDGALQWTP
jgi:Subtilase family